MANYALTVTPKFTPFTYDELIKPIETYQKVYDAYNEKYDAIEDEIAKWKALEKTDPAAYERYAQYNENLQRERDALLKNGLSANSRNAFSALRRQYASDIVPMNEAETRQKELIKRYEEAKLKDPTLLTDIDPRNLKISDLIENPNASFESYSGKLLQGQMENQMAALATEIRNKPVKWKSATLKQHYGFTRDEVLEALDNPYDPNSQNIINQIANSVLESSGILDWNTDDATKQQAYNWVMQGAMKGVGKDVVEADYYARQAASRAEQERLNSSTPIQIGDPEDGVYYNKTYGTLVQKTSNGGWKVAPQEMMNKYKDTLNNLNQSSSASNSSTNNTYDAATYSVAVEGDKTWTLKPDETMLASDIDETDRNKLAKTFQNLTETTDLMKLWQDLTKEPNPLIRETPKGFVVTEAGFNAGFKNSNSNGVKDLENIKILYKLTHDKDE